MKKRILAAGILMLMFIVTACGNDELVETPEETGLGRCECRISRIGRKEGFEDAGHAMAWALTKVK